MKTTELREATSARDLNELKEVIENLLYFYGNAPITGLGINGVRIDVLETTLTDRSKQIDYYFKGR